MKDISIYFSPVEDYCPEPKKGFLNNKISIHTEKFFPSISADSLVLFSIPEFRRTNIKSDYKSAFINMRKALANLSDNLGDTEFFDLGVIAPGETIEDTYYAIKCVLSEVLKIQAYPIIIGGGHDLLIPIYQSYEDLEQIVNICTIDHKIDLGNPSEEINHKGFLSHLLMHQPGHLFNYSVVGTQTHFLKTEEIELFDRLYFDILRLGDLNANSQKAEPIIRNSDIVNIDLGSLRFSDYQNEDFSPNGISSENICRLSRYAGYSDKVSSFSMFNYSSLNDQRFNEASIVAQTIWYFISGFQQRKKDFPVGSKKMYAKFTVTIQDMKDEIVFYKSDKTERWWMEVPYPPEKGIKFERHYLVPCDYQDYEKASQNELPDLWWKTYRKLI
jgi:arginase family enzyme